MKRHKEEDLLNEAGKLNGQVEEIRKKFVKRINDEKELLDQIKNATENK